MAFLAKVDVDERRGARRIFANSLDGLLIGRESRFDVIIHNMSETGFLAEFMSDLTVGDDVRLRLSKLGFVDAQIMWKRGLGHGCQFRQPISLDVIEATIAARPSLEDPAAEPVPLARADRGSALPFFALSSVVATLAFTGLRMLLTT